MNRKTLKQKSNSYFAVYAGTVAYFILGLVIVTQFIAYRDIMYKNFIRDIELEASLLLHVIESPSENKDLYRNLNKQLSEQLQSEINHNRGKYRNILNLEISGFDSGTNSFYSLTSVDVGMQRKLTWPERLSARVADYINLGTRSVWYDGNGFIAQGSIDHVLDGKKYRMKITSDANGYIQQQIWAIFALALLMAGVVVVLALQYRVIVGQLKKSQEILESELVVSKRQREKIFAVYRDVIYAVTQGKLSLVGREEVRQHTVEGEKILEIQIRTEEDVTLTRREAKRIINTLYSEYEGSMKVLLCIAEAAANIIKHAGAGVFIIRKVSDYSMKFIFEDQGPGMDFDVLPEMIFYKGFSTKISAGCGFSLIYGFVDKMVLFTSKYGTTLIFDVVFANRQRNSRQGADISVTDKRDKGISGCGVITEVSLEF